ncbi:anti-sigma factor [Nocardioides insulae]|uniref:anti-sigma factor n=1 Tax=Nocardioides insulae TaxID=394734 RepID=UPI00040FA03C|nr:anti-sigma factor [Nocardioides insulae]
MSENGSPESALARPDVELRLPADGAYVSVLRTTAAGLAARLDFTLDDIEDLRMAVGEASALVLDAAAEGSDLTAAFWLAPGLMTVTVGAGTDTPSQPDQDSFAWQVLTALAEDASAEAAQGRLTVTFAMESTPLGAGL